MINVILLIDCSGEFDRKLLRGIVRYSNEHGPWQFYRMPSWYRWDENGEEHILDWAVKWKADAIIGRWNSPSAPLLKKLGIPIVLQNYHDRSKDYSTLTGDYIGTGRMAADFFIKRRFSRFAYFGLKDVIWSEERLQGFAEQVGRIGGSLSTLMIDVPENEARGQIARWLHTLTGPVAMFCCSDSHALIISEICNLEGIRIPEQVALLGVDNDDLYCEISDPPISSIELDVEQGGWEMCRLLDESIKGHLKEPFSVVIKPRRIVHRRSTARHDIADPLVGKIVDYIEDNFTSDISMTDILEQVPLSRRAIELRFKEEMKTSIYHYLLGCRLENFRQLLISTDRTLIDIALASGFRDTNNISRTFRKFYGESPLEYKARFCAI
ncbi:MAG: substrate-binding domain-containing protein [Bacteroidales bacterium]|nr:substrate-binding domain-containing protein [Bacteroidales bacterium]